MKAEFIHLSDVHLGYEQYGSAERSADFARAFWRIADYAVDHKVDFVVLGGDLFNKRAIDALTFGQALKGLERLKAAGIPVASVEGNHDRAFYKASMSWLELLSARGLMYLLDPLHDDDGFRLEPWNQEHCYGSYVDIKGVRIYGMKYYGASTGKVLQEVAELLPSSYPEGIEYSILISHSGVQGYLSQVEGGLTEAQLAVVEGKVDYIALGHIHKGFRSGEWVFNPGSPETWSTEECAWEQERGFYHVRVDTESQPKHQVELVVNKRRPFLRLQFVVSGLASPQDLHDRVDDFLNKERNKVDLKKPVVELTLSGTASFDRTQIDTRAIENKVREVFEPLVARVRNNTQATAFEIGPYTSDGRINRKELEKHVVKDLLERDARYRPASAVWSRMVVDVKNLALEKVSPDQILERIELAQQEAAVTPANTDGESEERSADSAEAD